MTLSDLNVLNFDTVAESNTLETQNMKSFDLKSLDTNTTIAEKSDAHDTRQLESKSEAVESCDEISCNTKLQIFCNFGMSLERNSCKSPETPEFIEPHNSKPEESFNIGPSNSEHPDADQDSNGSKMITSILINN